MGSADTSRVRWEHGRGLRIRNAEWHNFNSSQTKLNVSSRAHKHLCTVTDWQIFRFQTRHISRRERLSYRSFNHTLRVKDLSHKFWLPSWEIFLREKKKSTKLRRKKSLHDNELGIPTSKLCAQGSMCVGEKQHCAYSCQWGDDGRNRQDDTGITHKRSHQVA